MDQDQRIKIRTDDQTKGVPDPVKPQTSRGLGEKEKETIVTKEVIREVGKEIELPKEVEEAGVELKKEEVELPPPVQELGVKLTGPAAPSPPPAVTATLPLSDDQVVKGLAAPILSSIRWLAEFCLKQLKKAHIGLKKVHGKIVRVKG
jgi:hypothetical protein